MKKFKFLLACFMPDGRRMQTQGCAEVTYYVERDDVKVFEVAIPFFLLEFITLDRSLMAEIQAAAENNAMSNDLLPQKLSVVIHDSIAV